MKFNPGDKVRTDGVHGTGTILAPGAYTIKAHSPLGYVTLSEIGGEWFDYRFVFDVDGRNGAVFTLGEIDV